MAYKKGAVYRNVLQLFIKQKVLHTLRFSESELRNEKGVKKKKVHFTLPVIGGTSSSMGLSESAPEIAGWGFGGGALDGT